MPLKPINSDFRIIEITRALALASVLNDDFDENYTIRKVMRWYSKTFDTPLHIVEDLPLSHIFIHYWEEKFEEMKADEEATDEQFLGLIEEIILTSEQKEQRRRSKIQRESEDALFAREIEQMEAKNPISVSKEKYELPETSLSPLHKLADKVEQEVKKIVLTKEEIEELERLDMLGELSFKK